MTKSALLLASAAIAVILGPSAAAAQATHGGPDRRVPPNTASCTLSRSCAPGASVNLVPYVTLKKKTGTLRLDVSPAHAEVYVDGVYAGRAQDFDGASSRATMAAGAHRIEIRAEGFENTNVVARISGSAATVHRISLRPLSRQAAD